MTTRLLSIILTLVLAVACGTRAQELAAPERPDPSEPAYPAMEAEVPAPAGRAAPGPAPVKGRYPSRHEFREHRAEEEARSARAQAPTGDRSERPLHRDDSPYRPGLATSWGEARSSRVTTVHFERDTHAPIEMARIQYDDPAGVRAATHSYSLYPTPHSRPLLYGALTLSVVDGSEDPLPSVQTAGTDYVIGERGERYQIQIQNHSESRFEIVVSVDGLDVVDGRPGSTEKRGYLIAPHDTLLIEGFRTSDREVRAFRFGNVHESYAALRGRPKDVGVIGVAVFAERFASIRPWSDEVERRNQANPFPGRYSPPPGYE